MQTLWRAGLALMIALGVFWGGSRQSAAAPAAAWQNKVAAPVLAASERGETEFLVFMQTQADLSAAAQLADKDARTAYVYETLSAFAAKSQAGVRRQLENLQAEYRPFWIANMLWVRGDLPVVQALAQRPDVAGVYANLPAYSPPDQSEADRLAALELARRLSAANAPAAAQWNLDKVRASEAWNAGFRGEGVVIGGQDTGYQWDHPALINQYRGWNGSAADHNYNWHDAIHENDSHTGAGNPCGFNAQAPCDDHGHGTHTMGIMLGDTGPSDPQRKLIGVAPAAHWIACRNMEEGWGKPSTYSECYQWFVAPTDLNGQNPNPALAADIINNSWGCPSAEGCTDPLVMQTVVANVTAAGILTVHSAGNDGPTCSTVNTPAGIYADSFTVANTTNTDGLSGNSSRGPVAIDGSGRMKPEIAAPGTAIYSSYRFSAYTTLSGTSMAAPHVAGLAALLLNARPDLHGQTQALRRLVEQSAAQIVVAVSTPYCGGTAPNTFPNNYVGWGRIDAGRAVQAGRLRYQVEAPTSVRSGEIVTYTITISNTHSLLAAESLSLYLPVPAGSSFIGASEPYLTDGQGQRYWLPPVLQPGASWQMQFSLRADALNGQLQLPAPALRSAAGLAADEANLPRTQIVPPYQIYIGLIRK